MMPASTACQLHRLDRPAARSEHPGQQVLELVSPKLSLSLTNPT
jgi:hypothetical protein